MTQDQCPACGRDNKGKPGMVMSSTRGKNLTWVKCSDCHAYFCKDDFNINSEVSHGTTTSYGTEGSGVTLTMFKQRLYDQLLGFAQRYQRSGAARWIDLGCSFGGLIELVKAKGYDVEGFDILPQAVQHLKSKGIKARVAHTVAALSPNEQVDVFSAIDSNYYWPDQRTEFREIYNHLSEGGLFIIRTTDKSWLVSLGRSLMGLMPSLGKKMISRGLNDHRFSMPLASMLRLLKEEKFKVREVAIANAYYSDQSGIGVKTAFNAGAFIYSVTGKFLAPGAIIVASK